MIIYLLTSLLLAGVALGEEPILRLDTGGHMGIIKDIIPLGDGRHIITASDDKTIRIWDTRTGRTVRRVLGQIGPGFEGKVYAIALSPDGRTLAVGGFMDTPGKGMSGKIRLYDLRSGKLLRLLKGHENVIHDLAFSPDGSLLASGSSDRTVRVWEMRPSPPKLKMTLRGHKREVYGLSFTPDGRHLVSASYDRTARVWDLRTGETIHTIEHTDMVDCVACSPDGRFIATGDWDERIIITDARSFRRVRVIENGTRPSALAFSPDSRYLLAGCYYPYYKCNVYSVPDFDLVSSFRKHRNLVMAVAFLRDGVAVTGGGEDEEIYIWDIRRPEEPMMRMAGDGKRVWSVGIHRFNPFMIGFGNTWTGDPHTVGSKIERAVDIERLEVMEVEDEGEFMRHRRKLGEWSLEHTAGGDYGYDDAVLLIKRNGETVGKVVRGGANGYRHRCYTFTEDGRFVISGGAGGKLYAYDLEGGEVAEFVGHEGEVWSVAVSGDYLVSGSDDQTIMVWSLRGLGSERRIRPLASIFVSVDGEFVIWTPEGYYASSLRGARYVGWHLNRGAEREALFFPASRFPQFDRPDIVLAYIRNFGDLEDALAETNAKPVQISEVLPPELRLIKPDVRYLETEEEKVEVIAEALPTGPLPITDIKILLDGGEVRGDRAVAVVPSHEVEKIVRDNYARIRALVRLSVGEHLISVVAENERTGSEPLVITVVRKRRPGIRIRKPNLYLLAIGVGEYRREEYRLDYPDDDAMGIAERFRREEGKLYGKVVTRLLVNEKATREAVVNGLEWILEETTQYDVAVVFVAGHGLKDTRGNYYFLPWEGDLERLRSSGVRWIEFKDTLTSLPCRGILMVDTCYSGGVWKGRDLDMTEALKELLRTEGVVVMSASTRKEKSYEDKRWGHGAFTKAILEGLEGKGDYNGNGEVTIYELNLYVTERVKELTRGKQHAATAIPETIPDFPIVKVR
jgi:WD40 repeat protein